MLDVPMLQLNFVVRALIKMVFGATLGPGSHAVGVNRSVMPFAATKPLHAKASVLVVAPVRCHGSRTSQVLPCCRKRCRRTSAQSTLRPAASSTEWSWRDRRCASAK